MRQDEENEDITCADFQKLYAETIRLAQQKVSVTITAHSMWKNAHLLMRWQSRDSYSFCVQKITAKNAWELSLIDHIGQLSQTNGAEEVDFQRASTAIDASCSIYRYGSHGWPRAWAHVLMTRTLAVRGWIACTVTCSR